MSRLKEQYQNEIIDALIKKFGYKNIMEVPKLDKVVVEGVNVIKKHTKPSAANQNGGIITKEAAIDASNVMYVHKGKATRVGFKIENDKKVRFAKSTGEVID